MATKIRLARAGSKKRPFYRIVAADVRAPRDGKFIEKLGTYNPLLPKTNAERVVLVKDRIQYWLDKGAKPTDRVLRFLDAEGMMKREPRNNPKKAMPRKKTQEKLEEKKAKEASPKDTSAADTSAPDTSTAEAKPEDTSAEDASTADTKAPEASDSGDSAEDTSAGDTSAEDASPEDASAGDTSAADTENKTE